MDLLLGVTVALSEQVASAIVHRCKETGTYGSPNEFLGPHKLRKCFHIRSLRRSSNAPSTIRNLYSRTSGNHPTPKMQTLLDAVLEVCMERLQESAQKTFGEEEVLLKYLPKDCVTNHLGTSCSSGTVSMLSKFLLASCTPASCSQSRFGTSHPRVQLSQGLCSH